MSRVGFEPTKEYAKLTPGDRIRIMCEFKGMLPAELARKAKMHATHLSAIMNDKRPLGIALARRIAKALDISISYLIDGGEQNITQRKSVDKILNRLKRRVHRVRLKGEPIGEITERHFIKDLDDLNAAL